MSPVVATVKAQPDKYEKNFVALVTFLTQYIDRRGPTLSMKVCPFLRPDLPSGRRHTVTTLV